MMGIWMKTLIRIWMGILMGILMGIIMRILMNFPIWEFEGTLNKIVTKRMMMDSMAVLTVSYIHQEENRRFFFIFLS